MNSKEYGAVSRVMESYFDGLYHADSTSLRRVFHPHLAYVCATEGDELHLDLDAYMARVDLRKSPAEQGEPRDEAVLEIAFGSDRLARVTARMRMMDRDYLDFLTLIRDSAEWLIVAKVFTYISHKD